ncbi:hypothetical protein BX070DRAFT_262478 [Coemansia spiralis]|nr:hypothetical protein BX070DRAFT_262478 [Coemansia spiralis]
MQTPVSPKNGGSEVSIDLSKSSWTADEFRTLLQLAKTNRMDNQCISWKRVMDHVSAYTLDSYRNLYYYLLRQYREYISGNNISDYYKGIVVELQSLLQECHELDKEPRKARTTWTVDQDIKLLELSCQYKTYRQIADILGKKNGQRCKDRIQKLIERQEELDKKQMILANRDQLVTGKLPDGRIVTLGPPELISSGEKEQITKSARTWTQANDDKLYGLVREQGKFEYRVFKEHFPGVGYAEMRRAFQRISTPRRNKRNRLWTEEEEQTLMQLVDKYGKRWKRIAEEMPTDHNPNQCQAVYLNRSKGIQRIENIWPEEESLRLEILVELSMQNKLLSSSEQEDTTNDSRIHIPFSSLVPDISASVDELKRQLAELRKLRTHEELLADPNSRHTCRIHWKLIAPHMLPKTVEQCSGRWRSLQLIKHKASNPFYEGPWTRDEDLQLYRLYTQAPSKWKWISENLPRYRDYTTLSSRYNTHIKYYVDLLKRKRGADWSPTDDQFKEVHRLCEIKAWRHRLLKGYRIIDGHKAPANLDVNGDSYCFDN